MSKDFVKMLKAKKAHILINDGWNEKGEPTFEIKKVTGYTNHRGVQCVCFDAFKMTDGQICTGVAVDFVLGYAFASEYNVDGLNKWLDKHSMIKTHQKETLYKNWSRVMCDISLGFDPLTAILFSIPPPTKKQEAVPINIDLIMSGNFAEMIKRFNLAAWAGLPDSSKIGSICKKAEELNELLEIVHECGLDVEVCSLPRAPQVGVFVGGVIKRE